MRRLSSGLRSDRCAGFPLVSPEKRTFLLSECRAQGCLERPWGPRLSLVGSDLGPETVPRSRAALPARPAWVSGTGNLHPVRLFHFLAYQTWIGLSATSATFWLGADLGDFLGPKTDVFWLGTSGSNVWMSRRPGLRHRSWRWSSKRCKTLQNVSRASRGLATRTATGAGLFGA